VGVYRGGILSSDPIAAGIPCATVSSNSEQSRGFFVRPGFLMSSKPSGTARDDRSDRGNVLTGLPFSLLVVKDLIMWQTKILALGALLVAPIVFAAASPPVEPMPTLDAATLAPPALLNGAGYTIDATVPVAGYMGQFTLRAPAGTFTANGNEMLAIRIAELSAIAQLSQLSQSKVFTDAMAASAMKTGAAIGQAVLNPVDTIAGIPAGIGRFFQSASTTVSRATESSSSNPQQTADVAMDALGLNKAKRQIAKQVGADPYTTNPVLAKQLNDLGQAAFSGGVSLDVALAVSTAGVATAISTTASVSNLVWEKSPEDVRTANQQKLAAMGVGGDTVQTFVTNRWLTPTLSVPLVEHLAQMPAVKGRAAVVALASTVASEGEARFVLNTVSMARRVGTDRDPVVSLDVVGRIVVVRTRGGRTYVPAPVDYVVWTEPVKAFAERKNLHGAHGDILVTGLASARARDGMQAARWTVKENVSR
jgi:hypothetical protein